MVDRKLGTMVAIGIVGIGKTAVFPLFVVQFRTLNIHWTGNFPLYPVVAFICRCVA
jgi:hypothetical protein